MDENETVGHIGNAVPDKAARYQTLVALGGIPDPTDQLIFLAGATLPRALLHLAHEWTPVRKVPAWALQHA